MIFKSLWIKEGIAERTFAFSNGANLIFSSENSKGKTTLIRFLLYSLGYSIPSTRKIKFERCEVVANIFTDRCGEMILSRYSNDYIEATINGEKITYILPDQLNILHAKIWGTESEDLLNNILGAIYADQEKGWTLLNRGTVIGSIHFKIEELIRGLSGCDCSELIRKETQISEELAKYRQMFSVAQYREKVLEQSGTLVADSYQVETDAKISQLLIHQKALKAELRRIDNALTDNKRFCTYVAEMKLMIQLPDGSIMPVTADNIVGLTDTIDFLVAKRKMVSGELRGVMHQLEKSQKEQQSEAEQLAFLKSETLMEVFDRKIAAVPMNIVAIEREIKRLEGLLKSVRDDIKQKTKSDTGIIKSLYDNIVKYATELGVGNSETIASSYMFTSNLKELSGAVLHKTVFAFRLAYILEIQKHLGIKLPLILDSPSGKEVDQKNIQLMMTILKRDFSENQIIIASIYEYDFDNLNYIEIKNRLIESQ